MKKRALITSLEELATYATDLVTFLNTSNTTNNGATVVTLTGDLGAGKTTLSQMIGQELGVTEPISSPTFVISKYYDLKKQNWRRLIHMDAYRLEGQNLEPLDLPTLFADSNNIILIEWPEYIMSALPKKHTSVSISHDSNNSRHIFTK